MQEYFLYWVGEIMKQGIEIMKKTMDTFMNSYETNIQNVMMLAKIVERQQDQIYRLEERIEMLEKRG